MAINLGPNSSIGTPPTTEQLQQIRASLSVLSIDEYTTSTTLNQLKGSADITDKIGEEYIPDVLNVSGLIIPDTTGLILPVNILGVDSAKNLYVHDGVISGGIPVKGRTLQGVTNVSTVSSQLNTTVILSRSIIDVTETVSGLSLAIQGDISISGLAALTSLEPGTKTATLGIRILNGSSVGGAVIARHLFNPGVTYDMSTFKFNGLYKINITGELLSTSFANATYSALNYVSSTETITTDMPSMTKFTNTTALDNGLIIDLYLTYRYIEVAGSNITVSSDLKVLRS